MPALCNLVALHRPQNYVKHLRWFLQCVNKALGYDVKDAFRSWPQLAFECAGASGSDAGLDEVPEESSFPPPRQGVIYGALELSALSYAQLEALPFKQYPGVPGVLHRLLESVVATVVPVGDTRNAYTLLTLLDFAHTALGDSKSAASAHAAVVLPPEQLLSTDRNWRTMISTRGAIAVRGSGLRSVGTCSDPERCIVDFREKTFTVSGCYHL